MPRSHYEEYEESSPQKLHCYPQAATWTSTFFPQDDMLNLQLLLGLGLGILVAAIAYTFGALTSSGALAAAVVGAITFGVGGLKASILLLAFFVSSSALSRVGGERKRSVSNEMGKGARRDHVQVLANGSVAALCVLGYGLTGDGIWFLGFAGALAAVNADTWSTELGVLAKEKPRLLFSGAPVQPGTSGGITTQGVLAAFAGAMLIAALAELLLRDRMLLVITFGGFLGALVDSLLGGTVQVLYHCPSCEKITEKHPQHHCGTQTVRARGWAWLNNDGVNFVASMTGAVITCIVWVILKGILN